jgi:hypothetical protein
MRTAKVGVAGNLRIFEESVASEMRTAKVGVAGKLATIHGGAHGDEPCWESVVRL